MYPLSYHEILVYVNLQWKVKVILTHFISWLSAADNLFILFVIHMSDERNYVHTIHSPVFIKQTKLLVQLLVRLRTKSLVPDKPKIFSLNFRLHYLVCSLLYEYGLMIEVPHTKFCFEKVSPVRG